METPPLPQLLCVKRRHVGLGLRQVLQRLTLAAHAVIAHASGDVTAALAHVEVPRRFVPIQDGEVELVATGSEAQLKTNVQK